MKAKYHALHAFLPSRLEWLCQPEQIEYTLRHIFSLNAWKKAHYALLYGDRQGLQEIQTVVLEHTSRIGAIQPVAYLDGTNQFPSALLLDQVGERAAWNVLMHIQSLNDPDLWPLSTPEGDRTYQRFIRPLYRRVTGKDFPLVREALHILEQDALSIILQGKVQELVERARLTRQPLSRRRLANLCLAPMDVLPIRENRWYSLDHYESWGNLESSDLRKLDPEGESQVAFQYSSSTAHYVFHLPFRRVERFLPAEQLAVLQRASGSNRERSVFQGRELDDTEGLLYPPKEILEDLGVNIARACPHELIAKEVYLAQPTVRDVLWPIAHEAADWADDPWDGLCVPPSEI